MLCRIHLLFKNYGHSNWLRKVWGKRMNEFIINDLYGYQEDYIEKVIQCALKHQKISNACGSVIYVGEDEIQRINKTYRNIDRVTDVISFAFEDAGYSNAEIRMLGDIYVCIPKMKEQAKAFGHSEKRELSFLVVHGLLHLLGYDHTKSKEEKKRMFQLQEEILNEAKIPR